MCVCVCVCVCVCMPFATRWMDFEDIVLSEISQTEKDKYCVISLIYGILKSQTQINRE